MRRLSSTCQLYLDVCCLVFYPRLCFGVYEAEILIDSLVSYYVLIIRAVSIDEGLRICAKEAMNFCLVSDDIAVEILNIDFISLWFFCIQSFSPLCYLAPPPTATM